MNYQEILAPVDDYKNHLKEAHAQNTIEAFEALLKRSGVDEQANVVQVKKVRALESAVNSLKTKLGFFSFLRGTAIVAVVISSIALAAHFLTLFQIISLFLVSGTWLIRFAVTDAVSLVLLILWLHPRVKFLRNELATNQEKLDAALAEAWQQMQPLNRLLQWDTIAGVVMKTMPIVQLDKFFSQARMDQLVEHFGLRGIDFPTQSVLCCQSGALNGNPLMLAETLNQGWGETTYYGSMTISWKEYDSDLKTTVTRTQTLNASVTKPSPDYTREKFIIYGNEAAPDLKFTREPNSYSDNKSIFDKVALRSRIKKLEKMSRDIKTDFTIMDNEEFDASFYAIDRDNEQQFRLLFTPLAQQEMLKLLQDNEVGFGDDFEFRKSFMINVIVPKHLQETDISGSPSIFRHYELAAARQNFIKYSNEFFHSFFFGIAPLLSIPLYQQHRSTLDIYKDVYKCGVSFYEYESLVNAWDQNCFAPGDAITPSILKTQLLSREEEKSRIMVTAHAFRGVTRVDYVPVYGDDERWHDVPVEWTEYLPTTRDREISVRAVPGEDNIEALDKIYTDEWQEYFKNCGVDYGDLLLRRNLVSFFN